MQHLMADSEANSGPLGLPDVLIPTPAHSPQFFPSGLTQETYDTKNTSILYTPTKFFFLWYHFAAKSRLTVQKNILHIT